MVKKLLEGITVVAGIILK